MLTVFVVGTGSLGSEIAAARLLAPYFGDSTLIWANTIGIVLVALSAGYWYGGKRADRSPRERDLYLIVLAAGLMLAMIPFVSDPFLAAAVDALDSINAGAFVGSLLAVSVLLALPVFVMGMVTPYAVRIAMTKLEDAGALMGRLYALGTLGSLAGNFASALILIPLIGTRRTFLVYALAFVGVALWGLRSRLVAVAPVVVIGLFAIPEGLSKPTDARGEKVIEERFTTYQYARVIERENGDRILELNEGQAAHSVLRANSVLTGGIWDALAVAPLAALETPPAKMAVLGNAAGSVARIYEEFLPETSIDGVEIDGELTELGRKYFEMDNPRLRTFEEDARPWLRRSTDRYDAILVDAYKQPYVPFYMATKEFFELVSDRLRPGGVVVVNVGHPEGSTDLEKTLTATMGAVFETVKRDPFDETNSVLIATDGSVGGSVLERATKWLPGDFAAVAGRASERIQPPMEGGSVFTDDRAPVEWLIDASLISAAANG